MRDLQKNVVMVVIEPKKAGNDLSGHQEQTDKLLYSHTMDYYVGIKMNRLELHVLKYVNLKNITLSDKQITGEQA